jgi:hypothetical protein
VNDALEGSYFTENGNSNTEQVTTVIVFFNVRGLIMIESVPECQRVNHQALPVGPDQAAKTSEKEKSAMRQLTAL